jgi:glucokinase
MVLGAAKGSTDFVYISIGTGVGIGIVSKGHVVNGHNGFAGSVGWTRVDGERIEDLIGGKGISNRYATITGKKLSAAGVFSLAEESDPEAEKIIDESARSLGALIALITNTINPEMIVLAGSIGKRWDNLREQALETMRDETSPMIPLPEVSVSNLGEDAQIIGTAILLQDSRFLQEVL